MEINQKILGSHQIYGKLLKMLNTSYQFIIGKNQVDC